MFKDIKGKILLLKEVKSILAFFGISGVVIMDYTEQATAFFFSNAPSISLTLFIVVLIYIEMIKQATDRKISEIATEQRIFTLKQRVDSAYKEYGKNPIIDRLVIASLMDLKKELDELQVNSYTQGKLEVMLGNIEYE